jgi:hypothetical protein
MSRTACKVRLIDLPSVLGLTLPRCARPSRSNSRTHPILHHYVRPKQFEQ